MMEIINQTTLRNIIPSSELIPYYGSHDTSMKVRKQIAWSEDIKKSVWTEIVTEKIRKQAENLERWDRTEAQMLYEYITQIEFGDATNREGHAAKVYFNALFGLILIPMIVKLSLNCIRNLHIKMTHYYKKKAYVLNRN